MPAASPAPPTTRAELGLLVAARPAMAALLLAGHALHGIRRVPGLGWVTADPVLARRVLGDHAHFTILGEGGVGHLWEQVLGPWVLDLFDGPGHHDLRSRSRELFTEASGAALVESTWGPRLAVARSTLAAGGEVDVAHLARALVGRMMISLLGVPSAGGASGPDRPQAPDDAEALATFRTGERLARIALGTAGSTALPPAKVAEAKAVVAELTRGVPDGWRTAPPDTLLGRCRELGLGLAETTGIASLLMVAGTETSASAMARTVALLVDTGEQHRLLEGLRSGQRSTSGNPAQGVVVVEHDVVTAAVREGLRVTSPASVVGRGVSADVEVGGRTLRAGERVMLLTWSANTGVGPFRVDRPYEPRTRQLWFGAGRHLCLGAALARAEIAGLLHALYDDGAPLRVVRRRAQRRVLVPGYESLVVARR